MTIAKKRLGMAKRMQADLRADTAKWQQRSPVDRAEMKYIMKRGIASRTRTADLIKQQSGNRPSPKQIADEYAMWLGGDPPVAIVLTPEIEKEFETVRRLAERRRDLLFKETRAGNYRIIPPSAS